MEPLVDFVIEDARWEEFGLEPLADQVVRQALTHLNLPAKGFTLCVMACDDTRIATLNADHRGKPKPTNVLSWPSDERASDSPGMAPDLPTPGEADDPEHLGDIAIAYDTCAREAAEAGKPMAEHVTHLVVHGFLHLLGYDHIDDADAELMESTETAILARMGLSDPY
ncbi:rRNA maturation RNase YbeY [Tabrizicola sp. KVB23]|uniref:Endoribonuclease YbeY n=1 Tax=Fuscibacter oryzae TaxID=2803939 RepID=A0A8J7MWD1_9RHOB|nr:rRNA maturation RNase YbeY [Fuscibacter oryzae]